MSSASSPALTPGRGRRGTYRIATDFVSYFDRFATLSLVARICIQGALNPNTGETFLFGITSFLLARGPKSELSRGKNDSGILLLIVLARAITFDSIPHPGQSVRSRIYPVLRVVTRIDTSYRLYAGTLASLRYSGRCKKR